MGTMEAGEGFCPCSPKRQLTGLGPQNDSLWSTVRPLAMTSGSPHHVACLPLLLLCPAHTGVPASVSVLTEDGATLLLPWQLTKY